jgi:Yip1 domain
VNSFSSRVFGVIRRPRATFAAILRAPSWASVLAATTAVSFICSAGFLRTDIGRQALVDQWERTATAFGQTVDDARYAQMEDTVERGRFSFAYAAATALANGPALAFALAALLLLVLNRTTSRRACYVEVLAVVCYAGVILTLRQVVATPIDYMRESIASPTTLIQFFAMLDEASPTARFLSVIDLFVIWWIVVLAIGVSVLYQRPARRLALVFTGAYIGLAFLAALAMAASGGTA